MLEDSKLQSFRIRIETDWNEPPSCQTMMIALFWVPFFLRKTTSWSCWSDGPKKLYCQPEHGAKFCCENSSLSLIMFHLQKKKETVFKAGDTPKWPFHREHYEQPLDFGVYSILWFQTTPHVVHSFCGSSVPEPWWQSETQGFPTQTPLAAGLGLYLVSQIPSYTPRPANWPRP